MWRFFPQTLTWFASPNGLYFWFSTHLTYIRLLVLFSCEAWKTQTSKHDWYANNLYLISLHSCVLGYFRTEGIFFLAGSSSHKQQDQGADLKCLKMRSRFVCARAALHGELWDASRRLENSRLSQSLGFVMVDVRREMLSSDTGTHMASCHDNYDIL